MPALRFRRHVLLADGRPAVAQPHFHIGVVFGNEQIARIDRHESGIAQIVVLAVRPESRRRLAEQLRDALPHIFRPFDRKVWQPFVEHRAARWPLLQALKRGLAARLTLKIVQAENVWDRRDVVRPSLVIDGEQFGASEKRRGRIARCRPVRQNEVDGDQEIGSLRIAGARFQFHFTPTYSAWLNLVERFFGLLTEHALKRGSHSSPHALRHAIYALRGRPQRRGQTLQVDKDSRRNSREGEAVRTAHRSSPRWPQMTNDFLKKSKIKGTRRSVNTLFRRTTYVVY